MIKPAKKITGSLFFWTIISLFFLLILIRIYYRATDDFRIGNITYELPHHKEWEIPSLSIEQKKDLDSILSQSFYYLGKGSQCYAFSSEDNQYVLKFFKYKHLKPHWFVEMLPPPFTKYRVQQSTRKQKKLDALYEGYRLAYEVYRPESGLVFIHLNKTQNAHGIVNVYDKLGFQQQIDLDNVVFLVQKKGKITRNILNEDLSQKNITLAKKHIRNILDLYAQEYQRGIFDKDHGVLHNTGFVNESPIHLDVGKLTRKESLKNRDEAFLDMQLITNKFKKWIEVHFPEYYREISHDVDAKVNELYGN